MTKDDVKAYLGERVTKSIYCLPEATRTILLECVMKWKQENKDPAEVIEEILTGLSLDIAHANNAEIGRNNEIVSNGINAMLVRRDWVNLNNVAKHAAQSAYDAIKSAPGEIEQGMVEIIGVRNLLLSSGISEYQLVIDRLKVLMKKQANKWINLIIKKPESEHAPDWRRYATSLVKDIFDLEREFHFEFENKDVLFIERNGVNQIRVAFGKFDEASETPAHPLIFRPEHTQVFHAVSGHESVVSFIHRVISTDPSTLTNSIAIEDILSAQKR